MIAALALAALTAAIFFNVLATLAQRRERELAREREAALAALAQSLGRREAGLRKRERDLWWAELPARRVSGSGRVEQWL